MLGLMQNRQLLVSSIIDFADKNYGDVEIVSKTDSNQVHRYSYSEATYRIKKLINALKNIGLKKGDKVATLAWNDHRHFELYYAISSMGAILHTINPRLFEEQIIYISNHAEDSILFFDQSFANLVNNISKKLVSVKKYVIMKSEKSDLNIKLDNIISYENFIDHKVKDLDWPNFKEEEACSLCYTSGTTGNPKGVLYSHKSTLLHAWATSMPDTLCISASSVVMPVVPMFHANAWGLVYAAPMTGAKLVLPGSDLDGESIYKIINDEKVTISAGVPTVWLMLLNYMDQNRGSIMSVKNLVIGGSAAPKSMIKEFSDKYNVTVLHAWGMTEMSPLGTVCRLLPKHNDLSIASKFDLKAKQGRAIFGVEMKITDDSGVEMPRDGKSFGNLKVKGPWVAEAYYKEPKKILDEEGWFNTGDVATIDPDGFMQITDRSKDVIKSGGEWISSIDLENIAIGHEKILEACVIGIPDTKWDERPLLLIVQDKKSELTKKEVLDFFVGKVAKWWIPDDVIFLEELPHTATGKLLKSKLRDEFKNHKIV
ncbi:MAG: long-chain fatty acid--CoA ligase [Rhodospirillaceae bacterium]|nr:long-chain fatty acid--CoA ligase [Rhodospirillaceae bacterium]